MYFYFKNIKSRKAPQKKEPTRSVTPKFIMRDNPPLSNSYSLEFLDISRHCNGGGNNVTINRHKKKQSRSIKIVIQSQLRNRT